jgi:hypothetical protein
VYTLRRLGPPQNSELFPLQTMLQPLAGAGAPPLEKVFPQSLRRKVYGTNAEYQSNGCDVQHSAEYSTPARVYPAARQASVQLSTVLLEAPPMGAVPTVRVLPPPTLSLVGGRTCVSGSLSVGKRKVERTYSILGKSMDHGWARR